MMGSRPRDPGVTFEQYAKEGYDYIVDLHNSGFFLVEPSLVWVVDFTSTAIKQLRYFTYGAKVENNKSILRATMCTRTISLHAWDWIGPLLLRMHFLQI
jgi:xanthine dehydrogenase molybdopterin-binding subunit B